MVQLSLSLSFVLFNGTWQWSLTMIFFACKSPELTASHKYALSTWWLYMATLIFLGGLWWYVWVNILTFITPKAYGTLESEAYWLRDKTLKPNNCLISFYFFKCLANQDKHVDPLFNLTNFSECNGFLLWGFTTHLLLQIPLYQHHTGYDTQYCCWCRHSFVHSQWRFRAACYWDFQCCWYTALALSLSTEKKHRKLTLTVLNFWKFTSYGSLKPLWSGMGEVVPARTSPTLHPPSPPTVHQLSWLAF